MSAVASPPPGAAQEALRVRAWSEEEFASSRAVWDGLLAESDADPLFMSWDWQWRWWKHHAGPLRATLRMVAAYSASGSLVGLAPFYAHTASVRGVLRRRRLELIGIAWRNGQMEFSDYLDLIAARPCRRAVAACVSDWLAGESSWQDLALCCTKRDGVASEIARTHLVGIAHVREVDPAGGWSIALPAHFEEYVARLGPDVRRKLFRQRTKMIEPRLERATEADLPEVLASLKAYVDARWQRGAGASWMSRFQLDFAAEMARQGRLRLTRLSTRSGPVSIMYNVRAGNTVYYLQSGFDPSRCSGLSPGYLHFGYAIEEACREGASRFELLAGTGRHRDYKRDLLAAPVAVASYHGVRGALSRWVYAAYQHLTERAASGSGLQRSRGRQ